MRVRLRCVVVCLSSLATLASLTRSPLDGQTPAQAWLPLPNLPIAVRSPAAATDGERVYVVGGTGSDGRTAALQILDLTNRQWSMGAPLPEATDWASAVWVAGELHVMGGVTEVARATTRHLVYNRSTNRWRESVPLPAQRAGAAAIGEGANIFVFAGNSGGSPAHTSDTYVFDVQAASWSTALAVPGARINWAGTSSAGRIHLVGGGTPGLETSGDVLVFDPAQNSWVGLAPLAEPREAHAVASTLGMVCVVGGRRAARGNFAPPFSDVFCYRADGGAVVAAPRLPVPRQELVGVSLTDGVLVLGGATADRRPLGEVWLLRIR